MPTTHDQRARWLGPLTGTVTDQSVVRLYELDLSPILSAFTHQPGEEIRYHDGEKGGVIWFNAKDYNPWPIKAEGFELSTRGTLPRPKLNVSNIGSVVSALCREYDDCVGAILTLRHTFAAYLSTPAGSEPSNKQFVPLIFVVERKTVENNTLCSFDLATPFDAEGILLPRRQILATACPWCYRGTECAYPAPPTQLGISPMLGMPVANRLGVAFGPSFSGATTATVTPPSATPYSTLACPNITFTSDDVGLYISDTTASGTTFAKGTRITQVIDPNTVKLDAIVLSTGTGKTFRIGRITAKNNVGASVWPPQQWYSTVTYAQYDAVYIVVKGVRVYAVSKVNDNANHSIYDENYWMLDVCLKKQVDCEWRYNPNNQIPYGGFESANKLQ